MVIMNKTLVKLALEEEELRGEDQSRPFHRATLTYSL